MTEQVQTESVFQETPEVLLPFRVTLRFVDVCCPIERLGVFSGLGFLRGFFAGVTQ